MMLYRLIFFILTFLSFIKANAQGCTSVSTGLIPINDLGAGTYMGMTGGLYPGASNSMPAAHKTAGLLKASQVQCLSFNGVPDAFNGKIAWLSIGMSNTTQETQQFIPIANAYTGKNPKLTLVDGAQGGMTAQIISTPSHPNYSIYWSTVASRLASAGVTNQQVQIIWLKAADQALGSPYMQHYDSLVVRYKRIMHELKIRFPNVKICYLSSRISARYATSPLNPEPYAYLTGWAVKKVIADQIAGDPSLQFTGVGANSPWLSWGCYMWSDGSTPQVANPSVFWNCATDFLTSDYTHPNSTGALKAANLWLQFHTSDPTAKPWFLGAGCITSSNTGIKFHLSGFYAGNDLMQPVLYNQGVTGANLQQCDSVEIQFRSPSAPYTLINSVHTVVSTQGEITILLPFTGVFYLVVKHRSGLETWSNEPVLCYGETFYNFTNASNQAFGNNQIQLDSTTWGFFQGDLNQDRSIDALDFLILEPDIQTGNSGYLVSDLNGDGTTDIFDYLVIDASIVSGITSSVP
ncbi:MAG: hypothetical protein JNM95_12525 [Chitinophagaceae bacterium]|nr:hypothetical protein [Chitinophagaceae bacterium]